MGVGVGGEGEEFNILGIPMGQRGSLTDESIALMKELWTNPYPSYHSPRWNFSDVRFSPKPLQKPHIPVWVGGSSPGARRRAATMGDGWHPNALSPEEFSLGRQNVEDRASKAGRDGKSIVMSVRVGVDFQLGGAGALGAGRALLPVGDPGRMVEAVAAYQAAGAEHVVFGMNTGDAPAIRRVMESIARDVAPRFM